MPVVIAALLPTAAASAEAFDDAAPSGLFPEEERLVEGAADPYRAAFATARACARRALAELGVDPAPILRAEGRAPRWPGGFVGSITHCDGYRAAAVARASDLAALGIDAEPAGPLRPAVLRRVASPGEIAQLDALAAAHADVAWDRLLFSAKESVFKAWSPLTGRALGFRDAALDFDPAARTFTARLLVDDAPLHAFAGRWAAGPGLVLTAVAVPA
jgi:4'-phosphopantetheinyl transferase EntD